jgi:hypothetical protein
MFEIIIHLCKTDHSPNCGAVLIPVFIFTPNGVPVESGLETRLIAALIPGLAFATEMEPENRLEATSMGVFNKFAIELTSPPFAVSGVGKPLDSIFVCKKIVIVII